MHSRLGRPAPGLNARQQRRFEDAKRNRVPSHDGTPHDPQVLRPVPFRIPIRLPPPRTAVAPPKPSYSPTMALIRVRSKVVRAAHRCYAHRAQANYRAHLLEAREAWAHLIAHKAKGAVRGGAVREHNGRRAGHTNAARGWRGTSEGAARATKDKARSSCLSLAKPSTCARAMHGRDGDAPVEYRKIVQINRFRQREQT